MNPSLRTAALGAALAVAAVACGGETTSRGRPAEVPIGTTSLTAADVRAPARAGSYAGANDATIGLSAALPQGNVDAPAGSQSVAQWRAHYPFAASELDGWAARHPFLARDLARWNAEDPDQTLVLVEWAVTHVHEGVDAFFATHGANWQSLRAMRDLDPNGVDELVAWCRAAPRPAMVLMTRSTGFASISSR